MNPGRIAAFDRLVDHASEWPRIDPPRDEAAAMWSTDMDPRDAALGRMIERQAVRRWITLKSLLEHQLTRPWAKVEFPLQAALLGGAAQLILMDRIPEHAAVDETVEWAKRRLRPGAGGMVNAVLRGLAALREERLSPEAFAACDPEACDLIPLEGGGAWKLRKPVFSASPPDRLSQKTGLPLQVLLRWINRFGMAEARRVALHGLVQPPIFVHGLPSGTPNAELVNGTTASVWTGDHAQLVAVLAEHPMARVQDISSAMAVELTAGMQPRIIIDACAGRGTKSLQLAAQHPQAEVIASEPDEARCNALKAVAERVRGLANIRVATGNDLAALIGQADLLVLDVPCSNTGVLPRRIEAALRLNPISIQSLVSLQRQIVEQHLPLLKPGGAVLFATCSMEPEENERQVEWMTARLGKISPQTERRRPEGLPGDPPNVYRDGAFAALYTAVSPRVQFGAGIR